MSGPRVAAIVAVFNEADIIAQVIEDLVAQSISVYLLDHGSTDETVKLVAPWVGRGVVAIEGLGGLRFSLEEILRKKSELARTLEADWILHLDADEICESPWLGTSLHEGIGIVDSLGYNAVDFEVLNFFPVQDRALGGDVRTEIDHYQPTASAERPHVTCWKRTVADIDLVSSGGLDVRFAGRNVCPLPFLLRHYPIRSQAHGERKVFEERLPRFDPEERKRGWHTQYDGLRRGQSFLRDPLHLLRFDPVRARIHLFFCNRELEQADREARATLEERDDELARQRQEWQRVSDEKAKLAQRGHELNEKYRATLREAEEARAALARVRGEAGDAVQSLERRIDDGRRALVDEEQRRRAAEEELAEARAGLERSAQSAQVLECELDALRVQFRVALEEQQALQQAMVEAGETARREALALEQARADVAAQALAEVRVALDEALVTRARERERAQLAEEQARAERERALLAEEQAAFAENQARGAAEQAAGLERRLALLRDDLDGLAVRHRQAETLLDQVRRAAEERELKNRNYESELQASRANVCRLEQEIGEARGALHRINELEEQLREVYMSWSWQVTQPLRAGASLLNGKLTRRDE